MNCPYCGNAIPKERVKILRATGRAMCCVKCSAETPRLVLMEYGHKTAGYAVIVPRGSEQRALRCYRRSR